MANVTISYGPEHHHHHQHHYKHLDSYSGYLSNLRRTSNKKAEPQQECHAIWST